MEHLNFLRERSASAAESGNEARWAGTSPCQLLRCATSIGANAEEAQEAQTKADFVAKLSVSRKEAREAVWWLRLIAENGFADQKELECELSEARQLLSMIRSAVLTARQSSLLGAGTRD